MNRVKARKRGGKKKENTTSLDGPANPYSGGTDFQF